MLYNLLPHGSVFLAFNSSSNNQTAAISDRRPVKDSDWVLAGAASLPSLRSEIQVKGTRYWLVLALTAYLDFVDYVTTMYANLNVSVIVVFGF